VRRIYRQRALVTVRTVVTASRVKVVPVVIGDRRCVRAVSGRRRTRVPVMAIVAVKGGRAVPDR
jgi:hypothetical protein